VEPVDAIPYPGERPPAPGRLRLVQRFVNTVDFEHGREMLSSPERLRTVLADLGLLDRDAKVTAADLERARAVREALRSLAFANNGGETRSPSSSRLRPRGGSSSASTAPARASFRRRRECAGRSPSSSASSMRR
jgi:hypothetical protein